jgi:LysR family hydrogen peroxide-inducible transcriptional activator
VVDAYSRDSELLLAQGQVDLVLVVLPYQNKAIKYVPVLEDGIYLAVPKTDEINRMLPRPEERACTIEDLKILKEEKFVMYEKGRRMYNSSMEICEKAGFEPKVAFESNSCESLNAMIAGGLGVGFVPTAIDRINLVSDNVKYYLIDDKSATRVLTLGYMEKNLSGPAKEFIRMALEIEKEIIS